MKMLFALIAVACAAAVCLPLAQAGSGCGMIGAAPAAAEAEKAAVQTEKAAAEVVAKAQSACAVCGMPMSKDFFSDVDGKRVYFCSAACKAKFNADSKPYLEKMQKDGIAAETVPAAPAAK